MNPTPTPAKADLRRRLRARRRRLWAAEPDAGGRAADLAPLDVWGAPRVVAGYFAFAPEIDPAALLDRLAAAGARIVLPVVIARGEALVFRDAVPAADLVPDAAGLLAPPPGAPEASPDLVIAPLLGFDREGGRLGQGGRFYDLTLRRLRAAGPVTVIGLAYAGQELAIVPMEAHDERLDAILTEAGYRWAAKGEPACG